MEINRIKIKDFAKVVNGTTPSTKKQEYWNGDIKWITPAELIDGHNWYVYETERMITPLAQNDRNLKLLPKETVLLTSRAPIGKVAIVGEEMCTNQGFKAIICDKDIVNPHYLYFWLLNNKEFLNSLGRGATFKEISKTIVENILVPIPSIETQDKIVETIKIALNILKKRQQQIEALSDLKQSIFYEMFGDPISNNKGWKVSRVDNVVILQRGFDLPKKQRDLEGEIDVYGANGVLTKHSEAKVYQGGIITGRSGSIGDVYHTFDDFWPLNTTLFSKETYGNNLIYLRYLLQNFRLERFKNGTGVPTLNRNLVHKENIINVPIHLQERFAKKIFKIEENEKVLLKSQIQMELLYQSLLHKAFNGELFKEEDLQLV